MKSKFYFVLVFFIFFCYPLFSQLDTTNYHVDSGKYYHYYNSNLIKLDTSGNEVLTMFIEINENTEMVDVIFKGIIVFENFQNLSAHTSDSGTTVSWENTKKQIGDVIYFKCKMGFFSPKVRRRKRYVRIEYYFNNQLHYKTVFLNIEKN